MGRQGYLSVYAGPNLSRPWEHTARLYPFYALGDVVHNGMRVAGAFGQVCCFVLQDGSAYPWVHPWDRWLSAYRVCVKPGAIRFLLPHARHFQHLDWPAPCALLHAVITNAAPPPPWPNPTGVWTLYANSPSGAVWDGVRSSGAYGLILSRAYPGWEHWRLEHAQNVWRGPPSERLPDSGPYTRLSGYGDVAVTRGSAEASWWDRAGGA